MYIGYNDSLQDVFLQSQRGFVSNIKCAACASRRRRGKLVLKVRRDFKTCLSDRQELSSKWCGQCRQNAHQPQAYVAIISDINRLTRHRASTSMYSLAFRVRAIATQPVHRLQIRPIVHNQGASLPLLQVTSGSLQQCGYAAADRQTDTDTQTDTQFTQTRVTTIHFASSTSHAKCNELI